MDELSLENILTEDQINDLELDFTSKDSPTEDESSTKENKTENKTETTEVDPEELFGGEPESVGSEEVDKGKEDTNPTGDKTSPNFYSSIANALVEDGVFQTFSKEDIEKVKTAEDFATIISNEVKNQLDERQKRIDEALNMGIEPSEVQKYEKFISVLDSISEEKLSEEGDQGESLRKNLIYQDYINRGFSKERATKEVERSLEAGTDIEDAKDALLGNKDFYTKQYKSLIEKAKEENEANQKEIQKRAEEFKTSILNEKKAFGEVDLDKATRQKVYDSIMKPVYTDPDTGNRLTAIQKYESENKIDFLKNIGLIYVFTDEFKNLDKLVQGKLKKEMKKGLRELENTISNTSRHTDGSLNFASGSDPNSKTTKWDLDI